MRECVVSGCERIERKSRRRAREGGGGGGGGEDKEKKEKTRRGSRRLEAEDWKQKTRRRREDDHQRRGCGGPAAVDWPASILGIPPIGSWPGFVWAILFPPHPHRIVIAPSGSAAGLPLAAIPPGTREMRELQSWNITRPGTALRFGRHSCIVGDYYQSAYRRISALTGEVLLPRLYITHSSLSSSQRQQGILHRILLHSHNPWQPINNTYYWGICPNHPC